MLKRPRFLRNFPVLIDVGVKRARERVRDRTNAFKVPASLRCSGQPATIDHQFKERLKWLESAIGSRGVQKFLGGKIDVRGLFGGHYASAYTGDVEMQTLLIGLIDMLKRQEIAPICDVDSYYAAGKIWPRGMRIEGNRLIDCWASDK
jgi:hypothetical protein